ncbi:Protein NSP-INTERACTING KINASE 2 [Raphanus sativus]|uniref:Protein NSP-INTERACTING KINASE 2 isoform X2 n=1 Tax=Raphanus sativus TaxID=3726 RepID=A0A6J0JCW3_RAPSA|nr:protein NSP-INTERACTING KINASE 2 isoform X2 [Raphanus sativus]KAJ4888362.1 Protein NSP-INTERACTING KINASE 2 [Raphanus sativus]
MVHRRREVKKSYVMFSSTFFWIFFLCLSPAELIHGVNFEILALVDIKSSLIDPHGVLVNWDSTAVDPCSWNLITCSADNFVLSIGGANQDLSGTLASSIGNLTYLETVLLQNNYFTGNIPPEIGKLMKLKTLDLSNNNFSGVIPSTLSHPTYFQYLKLNNNSLTGTIPTSVANMTRLILLDLSYNNLSCPVPILHANTFNVMGNPQICSTRTEEYCNMTHPKPTSLTFSSSDPSDGRTINQKFAVQFGLSLACICLLIIGFGLN